MTSSTHGAGGPGLDHDHDHGDLRDRLAHVRWLAGGCGAGKTTVAALLARDHGLDHVHGDLAERHYVTRATPDRHPRLTVLLGRTVAQRWASSAREIFEAMPSLHGETFGLAVEYLLGLPGTGRTLVMDDFRTLPREVAPLLRWPGQAVYLLPTAEFRRAALAVRYRDPARMAAAYGDADPAGGFERRLARDALWDAEVCRQALAAGLPVLTVDGSRSAAELATQVSEYFRLAGDGNG